MDSIKKIFKIGFGPSSTHTMGVQKACETILEKYPEADKIEVSLYGSLASTGKGHLTDRIIDRTLGKINYKIIWKPEITLPEHPNGMEFKIFKDNKIIASEIYYSVGGGEISKTGHPEEDKLYPHTTMKDILYFCEKRGITLWEYVLLYEGSQVMDYLAEVWNVMQNTIKRGLEQEGVLPGGLGVARKAYIYYQKAQFMEENLRGRIILFAYALAVAEENAAGNTIVTAPTCGAAGVLPSVLYYLKETGIAKDKFILKAIATAGLVGNLIKYNASISGAEVGCQGEIGAACSMASSAITQLLGGTPRQIEYAAEMGLEHYLGLTCDPVKGLVQIPCIERNVFAANRALDCASYALVSDGRHLVSFDTVVKVMRNTGHDLPSLYKETSKGGLAIEFSKKRKKSSS